MKLTTTKKRQVEERKKSMALELLAVLETWAAEYWWSSPQLLINWGQAQMAGGVAFPRPGETWPEWIARYTPEQTSGDGEPRVAIAWPEDSHVPQTGSMRLRADGRLESVYTAQELQRALELSGHDLPADMVTEFVTRASGWPKAQRDTALRRAFTAYHDQAGTVPWELAEHRRQLAAAAIAMGVVFYRMTPEGAIPGTADDWRVWAETEN